MTRFQLAIETANAAFGDDEQCAAEETARILEHIAKRLRQGVFEGQATDINGNRVGAWALEP
jgi:hypothetical protein